MTSLKTTCLNKSKKINKKFAKKNFLQNLILKDCYFLNT